MSNYIKNSLISKAFTGAVCDFCDRIKLNETSENSMIEVMPLKDVTETLAKTSEKVENKLLLSDRGQELLRKVSYYKIPLNKNKLNWLELIDEVAHYEMLLEEAHDLGIDWDISEYDPVGLEQEIEYRMRQERAQQQDLYRSFYSNFSLGV
jgi:hypothetical protein